MTERPEPSTPGDPASPSEAAADWVVRLHSDQVTLGDRMKFEEWHTADEANKRAFAANAALWNAVGALGGDREARALLMRPAARAPRLTRRWVLGAGAMGTAAAAAAALWVGREPAVAPQHLQTARGERRVFSLGDGSMVTLNTDSLVRVSLTASARRIDLDRGEFFIKVAKDPWRPLRVFVSDHEVRALGTAFAVLRDEEEQVTHVTLHEGLVGIYGRPANRSFDGNGSPAVVLQPGQEATFAATTPISIRNVDLRVSETWREGRIVFDDTQLSDAVRNMNRYSRRRIVVGDAAINTLRVSGVFSTDSVEAFVEGLTEALPVRIVRQDETTVVLGTR